ncbi:hypothetical protein ZEAMMB73_Zm00001d042925 [Zea mays]|uniref:Uncharacterized protein n=1 Tax=Zea mays TaxID=4577 RepID=A0A1D6N7J5_MAIZE|nr:hypothetical protein ZEAMMB73_Zm00001d042925 [Zea mays]
MAKDESLRTQLYEAINRVVALGPS